MKIFWQESTGHPYLKFFMSKKVLKVPILKGLNVQSILKGH